MLIDILGFDNSPTQSTSDTSVKVKNLVTDLVEQSLGQSVELVSESGYRSC